jgi:hypothetical protein
MLAVLFLASAVATPAPELSAPQKIARVQAYCAALARRDWDNARWFLAPNARVWYEKKEGAGGPLSPGSGRFTHWDTFFHGRTGHCGWRVEDGAVVATATETNDFYRLLDWTPAPMRFSWWLDESGRITGFLIQALPETEPSGSRLKDAVAWAKAKHPDEIAHLMPEGRLDPTGDRAERWRKLLVEWRRETGLPEVQIAE